MDKAKRIKLKRSIGIWFADGPISILEGIVITASFRLWRPAWRMKALEYVMRKYLEDCMTLRRNEH